MSDMAKIHLGYNKILFFSILVLNHLLLEPLPWPGLKQSIRTLAILPSELSCSPQSGSCKPALLTCTLARSWLIRASPINSSSTCNAEDTPHFPLAFSQVLGRYSTPDSCFVPHFWSWFYPLDLKLHLSFFRLSFVSLRDLWLIITIWLFLPSIWNCWKQAKGIFQNNNTNKSELDLDLNISGGDHTVYICPDLDLL